LQLARGKTAGKTEDVATRTIEESWLSFRAGACQLGCAVSGECSTFDEYSDKIHQAGAVSFMTAPGTRPWNFAQYPLNRTVLHFGSVAGGAIIHGTTRSNLYLWFLESANCPDRIAFDGRITKSPGIVMIPPASHFTFACTGPARWISLLVELTNGGFNKYLAPIETIKIMMAPQVAELVRLVDAATAARKVINLGGLERLQATETSLLGLLDTILSNSVADRRYFDEGSEESISQFLECLRRDSQSPVLTLARAAGVSERTLHRLCWKYFQMGPKRYSKIRQLNLVRRAIRQSHSTAGSITAILSEHGVTEFGRFAIEYKALFNESPTETLQRYIVARSNRSHSSYPEANK
jgi:AraC-like DNA-binding protein